MTPQTLLRAAAAKAGLALASGEPATGAWSAIARETGVSRQYLSAAYTGTLDLSVSAENKIRAWLRFGQVASPTRSRPRKPCPPGVDLRRPLHELAAELSASPVTIARWRSEAGVVVRRGAPAAPVPPGVDLTRRVADVAREAGVSTGTVIAWRRAAGVSRRSPGSRDVEGTV